MNQSRRTKPHLTQAKIRRALDALMDVIGTEEFDAIAIGDIDRACDALREMQSRAVR